MKKSINCLSLFDGMSGCHIALDEAGIKVGTYYSSEIDKYAMTVTQYNYPDTIQMGSVTNWNDWDIDWSSIDLVTCGFPCQSWSLAGKQLGDKDERGMLFWTMLDVIKNVLHHNPKAKFLMENVKMKKEFEQYITKHTEEALGHVNKILINSALVSAQNRQRWYWSNIEDITQPEDKGIVLKDILEDGMAGDIVINQGKDIHRANIDKSHCLMARDYKGFGNQSMTGIRPCELKEFNSKSLCHHIATATDIKGNESIKRVYADSGKSPTMTTCTGGHREPKVLCGAVRGRYNDEGKIHQQLELRFDGKTNSLTTVQKDNVVVTPPTYRKLTVLECAKLQTIPGSYKLIWQNDNGKQAVSNSQLYKMIGNGFTIKVFVHIFSFMGNKRSN